MNTFVNNKVGKFVKGGQPEWAYEMQATTSLYWMAQAEELDRMVRLGWSASLADFEALRGYVQNARHDRKGRLPSKTGSLGVTFFLAAVSIENLLKGLFVIAHPDSVSGGKFKNNSALGCHQLDVLASEAGVRLSPDEVEFCRLGTEAILTFGRYHVGKSVSSSPTQVTIKVSALEVYDGLYKRLTAEIEARPFPPPSTMASPPPGG